jgi:hypothetical protein
MIEQQTPIKPGSKTNDSAAQIPIKPGVRRMIQQQTPIKPESKTNV